MSDVKFFDKSTQTSIESGDYVRINRPYAPNPGGRADYKMLASDFLAAVNALISTNASDISTLQTDVTALQGLMGKVVNLNVVSNFTFVMPADSILWKMCLIWNSGTVTVRIGTTLGGNEIMSDRTLTSLDTYRVTALDKYYGASTTIYVTISGGQIDMARLIQTDILT